MEFWPAPAAPSWTRSTEFGAELGASAIRAGLDEDRPELGTQTKLLNRRVEQIDMSKIATHIRDILKTDEHSFNYL